MNLQIFKHLIQSQQGRLVKINGTSMLPLFHKGDFAKVNLCEKIRFGDLVVFVKEID